MGSRFRWWKPHDIYCASVQLYRDITGLSVVDTTRPREHFVCFRDNAVGLPKYFRDFNHCFVFSVSKRNDQQALVQMEMLVNEGILGVVWLKEPTVENYLKILKKLGVTVIKTNIKPVRNHIQMFPRLNPLNCVALAKLIIGVKIWGCYTPNVLYKRLVRREDCSLIIEHN